MLTEDDLVIGEKYFVKMIDHFIDTKESLEDVFAMGNVYISTGGTYLGDNDEYLIFSYDTTEFPEPSETKYECFYILKGACREIIPAAGVKVPKKKLRQKKK